MIMVSLNSGDKLSQSLQSALKQSFMDFEVIIKDGNSTDDSFEKAGELLKDPRVKVYHEADTGIYDAMNQAVKYATGEYVYFLNCGDSLYETETLEKVANAIREDGRETLVVYGTIYNEKTSSFISPAPVIDGFTCYRNIPCHQACFYKRELLTAKAFETKYRIRGDYEHFLWCYYKGNASFLRIGETVSNYEGGGFSETKENLRRSKEEHTEITGLYMSKAELRKYRTILLCTLAPLRTWMANSPVFSKAYNKVKTLLYH